MGTATEGSRESVSGRSAFDLHVRIMLYPKVTKSDTPTPTDKHHRMQNLRSQYSNTERNNLTDTGLLEEQRPRSY